MFLANAVEQQNSKVREYSFLLTWRDCSDFTAETNSVVLSLHVVMSTCGAECLVFELEELSTIVVLSSSSVLPERVRLRRVIMGSSCRCRNTHF